MSADPAVAAAFQQSSGCGVLFVITVVNARSLTQYSQFKAEAELLLSPGATFTCVGGKGRLSLVQVEEERETVF